MFNDIMGYNKKLELSVKQLRKTGEAYANAERDYRVKLRGAALRLRDSGMAVTLIDKVVYGEQDVADARFERDVAEAVYNANQEAIQSTKKTIAILMNQYDKEWGNTK